MFMKKIKESRLPPHPSKIEVWYHHQNQPKSTNNYFDISIFHNTVDAVCSMYCPIDNFREILVISSLLSTNKNFWLKSGKQWIPFSDAERHVKSQFISFWKAIGFNSQCRNDSIHLRPVVCENSSDMLTRANFSVRTHHICHGCHKNLENCTFGPKYLENLENGTFCRENND